MSKLYIIPSHIGNPDDISRHIVNAVNDSDFIVCEDTRVTGSLLSSLGISKKLISYNDHNKQMRTPRIIEEILKGQACGLMADAGTPAISDPGFYLVREAVKNSIRIISIPGPAAFLTALAGSGLPTDSFAFYGFLPKKKGKRKKKIGECMHREQTAIFYESPRRIDSVLNDIQELDPDRQIVIGRELTKTFEQYIRGSVTDVINDNWQRKGEIVLLIKGDE